MTVTLYRNIEKALARHGAVQSYLDELLFAMKAHADVELAAHRHDGHAAIDIARGRIDHYLVLTDERGQKAALSIEFGRAGYIDPETGATWGAMDGLFILHRVARLPRKRKALRREVRRRPGRATGR